MPRTLILALIIFGLSGTATAALTAAWATTPDAPTVTILGAGNRLSVLVTAGNARLLIATGNDATAFGNALSRAQHPTSKRVDILLVAGQGNDLIAPASIRANERIRFAAAISPLSGAPAAFATAGEGLPPLVTPRRFLLNDEVSVVVEQGRSEAAPEAASDAAWRVLIQRGLTTVVILSDGTAASQFPTASPVAALVVAGEQPIAAWSAVPSPVLILGGTDIIEGRDLRADANHLQPDERWAVRVHSGEALPLRFVEAGLAVPREPAQSIGGTPRAGRAGRLTSRLDEPFIRRAASHA